MSLRSWMKRALRLERDSSVFFGVSLPGSKGRVKGSRGVLHQDLNTYVVFEFSVGG